MLGLILCPAAISPWCVQLSQRPAEFPSMLCASCKPHNTSQILQFHSFSLYCILQCAMFCRGHTIKQSSPRLPAALSKSPEALVGFLAYYAHPTGPITLLRYLGFIVNDFIFLLSTLSHACRGCTLNHLPDTLQLYPNVWEVRLDSQHAMHILKVCSDTLGFIVSDCIFLVQYNV